MRMWGGAMWFGSSYTWTGQLHGVITYVFIATRVL